MKKLILSLIAAIALGVGAMAQDSRVATLQHGTNIKAYYGPNALAEAHKGAVDGDIITLSAGEFNACTQQKPSQSEVKAETSLSLAVVVT